MKHVLVFLFWSVAPPEPCGSAAETYTVPEDMLTEQQKKDLAAKTL